MILAVRVILAVQKILAVRPASLAVRLTSSAVRALIRRAVSVFVP
jgi:hypothetical protein